ncbi:MAG TPA: hypothetical protein VK358_17880, partial [Longimicrobium sp.]|nr:hypothetical protein [Longimicrobium sp.]
MHRKAFLYHALALGAAKLSFPAFAAAAGLAASRAGAPSQGFARLEKPRAEWRRLLAGPAYAVLFEEDTEPAGTSPLDRERRAGTFV